MSSEQKLQAKDCDVCCSSNYYFVKCCYCEAEACQKCYETYILDQFEDKCMFCSKTWTFEFMQTHFRSAYMEKAYKDKKKQLLFEREKALLPQTQDEMQQKKREQERFHRYKRALLRLKIATDRLKYLNKVKNRTPEEDNEVEDLLHILTIRRKEVSDFHATEEKKEEKEEKKLPTYPCSVADCRGFLAYDGKKKLVCGMCNSVHCNKCRCEEEKEHKCDPNTLETIKLMDKDTRPCPNCSVPIYKTEGCDQMWCTKCHTPFSWKTGKIETGHIHNPHYWQYLQSSGKDLDAVRNMQAGVRNRLYRDYSYDHMAAFVNVNVTELFSMFTHLRYVELPRFVPSNDNKDLRIKYLQKETTDKNFLMTLYRREKKFKFDTEITQILTMYLDTVHELISEVFNRCHNKKEFMRQFYGVCLMRVKELTEYSKKEIDKLYHRYDYTLSNYLKACFDRIYIILQKPPSNEIKSSTRVERLATLGIPGDVDELTRAAIERALWED